jgi:hypothetical protein
LRWPLASYLRRLPIDCRQGAWLIARKFVSIAVKNSLVARISFTMPVILLMGRGTSIEGSHPVDTPAFTAPQIRKLAILINCFTVIGAEIVAQRSGTLQQAYANLRKFKHENKELLEEMHSLALKAEAVSALRLSEDLEQKAGRADALQILEIVRRCCLASVFLSHCIVASSKSISFEARDQPSERHLH